MLTQQYEQFLQKKGISLLEVLKWFFESYLTDEFAAVGFELDIPSKDTTYLEKCKLLATSVERILKQFKMLIENGNIDHELLSISSNPIFYKDIQSFVNDKYIYRVERELDYVFNSMFSNQIVLLIDTEKSDGFDSCYEFMNNVNIKIDEFDMGRQLIGRLINEGYEQHINKRWFKVIRTTLNTKDVILEDSLSDLQEDLDINKVYELVDKFLNHDDV